MVVLLEKSRWKLVISDGGNHNCDGYFSGNSWLLGNGPCLGFDGRFFMVLLVVKVDRKTKGK